MLCGMLKTANLFKRDGCDNCEQVLQLRTSMKRVMDCTSATFDGFVAMMQPNASWVAKWQRTDKFTKGLYAIRVAGSLPEDIVDELQAAGIHYRPRDGSTMD